MPFQYRQSAIGTYLSCPRKAAYVYLEEMPFRTNPPMALGRAGHAGIEYALRYKIETGALPPMQAIEDMTATIAIKEAGEVQWQPDERDERDGFVDRAIALVSTYVTEVAPTFEVTEVEETFTVDVGGIMVTGTRDVVTTEGHRDTKTTRATPKAGGSPAHRFQLGLYALASDVAFPTSVIDYMVLSERKGRATKADPEPVRERTVRHLPVFLDATETEEERQVAVDTIRSVHAAVERGDFPRNPLACDVFYRCDFMDKCMPKRASAVERAVAERIVSKVA